MVDIDRGDGTTQSFSGNTRYNTNHNYPSAGTYEVKILTPETVTNLNIQSNGGGTLLAFTGGQAKNLRSLNINNTTIPDLNTVNVSTLKNLTNLSFQSA